MNLLSVLRISGFGCLVCVFGASALGCSAKTTPVSTNDAEATRVTCDPLARREMNLTNILGVGQAVSGTYYVADEPNGTYEPRVFVSFDGVLYHRHVAGSGSNGTRYTLSYDDADEQGIPPQALLINVSGAKATAMALAAAGTRFFIGDPGANYESLSLIDPTAVASMKVMGLPHVVNYLGAVDGSTQMLVTRPIAGSAQDGRIFYGTKQEMNECDSVTITIGGAMSAPTTTAVCKIGSQIAQIELQSATRAFAPADAGASPTEPSEPSLDGYVFYCL